MSDPITTFLQEEQRQKLAAVDHQTKVAHVLASMTSTEVAELRQAVASQTMTKEARMTPEQQEEAATAAKWLGGAGAVGSVLKYPLLAKAPALAGIVGMGALGANVGSTLALRDLAKDQYGDSWKRKYEGKPGSFTARHPFLTHIFGLGLAPGIGSLRGGGHFQRIAQKRRAEEAKVPAKGDAEKVAQLLAPLHKEAALVNPATLAAIKQYGGRGLKQLWRLIAGSPAAHATGKNVSRASLARVQGRNIARSYRSGAANAAEAGAGGLGQAYRGGLEALKKSPALGTGLAATATGVAGAKGLGALLGD